MEFSVTDEKDILVMKLLNYFITKKNYSPIIIKGIDNEIWLENKMEEYKIIRIVTKNIYNDDQYKYDVLKTKHILKQIKRKMLSFSTNILSILTEVGDNFSSSIIKDDKNYHTIVLDSENSIRKNELLNKYFSDLKKSLEYKEEGFDLINKITFDISKKNIEESEKRNKMFKEKKPTVTYLIILINLIVFGLMYVFGNGSENIDTLIKFGANYAPLTKSGEYYRLITSAFLHIGVIHLLCNLYALYVIGPQIEQFFGRVKYILIYLFSAIMGSLFTLVLSGDSTVSAGASGAIFGLFGAILYFGYTYRGYIGNAIISQIVPVVLLNLFIGLTSTNIGNAAHIGGLVGGYVMSLSLGADIDESRSQKINGIVVTILLTIFMVYMAFFR